MVSAPSRVDQTVHGGGSSDCQSKCFITKSVILSNNLFGITKIYIFMYFISNMNLVESDHFTIFQYPAVILNNSKMMRYSM